MAKAKNRRNEHLVGVPRSDGTPYKLLPDYMLEWMLVDWIRGKDIAVICEEFKITRVQFHRQKEHKARMLKELVVIVKKMVNADMNSKQIGQLLDIPYEQVNLIISTML